MPAERGDGPDHGYDAAETGQKRTKDKGDVLNCCSKMPSLRKARLPGSCNLPEQLGMSPSRRKQEGAKMQRTPVSSTAIQSVGYFFAGSDLVIS